MNLMIITIVLMILGVSFEILVVSSGVLEPKWDDKYRPVLKIISGGVGVFITFLFLFMTLVSIGLAFKMQNVLDINNKKEITKVEYVGLYDDGTPKFKAWTSDKKSRFDEVTYLDGVDKPYIATVKLGLNDNGILYRISYNLVMDKSYEDYGKEVLYLEDQEKENSIALGKIIYQVSKD